MFPYICMRMRGWWVRERGHRLMNASTPSQSQMLHYILHGKSGIKNMTKISNIFEETRQPTILCG